MIRVVLLSAVLLTGCVSNLTPEAQVALAERQVSLRAVGVVSYNPMTGMIVCAPCWVSYDRNLGQGPIPPEKK